MFPSRRRTVRLASALVLCRSLRVLPLVLAVVAALLILPARADGQALAPRCGVDSPSIAEVHRAALMAAGLAPGSASGSGRARASAFLPSVVRLEVRDQSSAWRRAETRVGQDFDETLLADGSDVSDLARVDDRGLREVRFVVQWNLTPLLWTSDELALGREAERLWESRQELLDAVTELYFARASLLREAASVEDESELASLAAEIAELEAHLDARTGGWFTSRAADERAWCLRGD